MCRESFRLRPAIRKGKGWPAQMDLLHGGTLENGRVGVRVADSHGYTLRELYSVTGVKAGGLVTMYGGTLITTGRCGAVPTYPCD